jgi:hypothetical protein
VLVMIIIGWVVVLPVLVAVVLYRRSSVARIAEQEPVDADALIQQITAYATAEREKNPPSAASAPRPAGARSGY